jgi:cytochrome c oxidase cbb3-type subunit 3
VQGLASRIPDPTALQNYWISAGGGLGRGGRGRPMTVTVTPPNGAKVEGTVVRLDDFSVVVLRPDGIQQSFRRNGEVPVVEVNDPFEPHKKLLPIYTDKDIHDVTAYLLTLK